MKIIDKKSPFKVPDGYFTHFDQKLAKQIISINPSMVLERLLIIFKRLKIKYWIGLITPTQKRTPSKIIYGKPWPWPV